MVRQYRHAIGGWLLELPAGKLEADEDPDDCARREMEEEVGFRAAKLESLGWIWTTPGFTDERIWLYLASGLAKTQQELQQDEDLTVELLPFAEAVRMSQRGEINDGKSICALLRADSFLKS
jgi:ADP-ribose pyrophosphatase